MMQIFIDVFDKTVTPMFLPKFKTLKYCAHDIDIIVMPIKLFSKVPEKFTHFFKNENLQNFKKKYFRYVEAIQGYFFCWGKVAEKDLCK